MNIFGQRGTLSGRLFLSGAPVFAYITELGMG